ncbi:GH36 C-terminal domain-containing protein, partial [Nonomuraea sp. NPDC055795]
AHPARRATEAPREQYTLGERVVVLAFRRRAAFGAPGVPLRLSGLDPDARYRDEDTGAVHHGVLLTSRGLLPPFSGDDYASALIRLRKEQP